MKLFKSVLALGGTLLALVEVRLMARKHERHIVHVDECVYCQIDSKLEAELASHRAYSYGVTKYGMN